MKTNPIFIIRRYIYKTLNLVDRLFDNNTKAFVLCYHGIDSSDWRFSISLIMFKKQIKHLKNEGYSFITTKDILEYCQGKKILPKPSVAITFDDGYKSMKIVAKFLKEEKIEPTLFLLSQTVKPNWKEIGKKDSFLNFSEIKSLERNGWLMGSHSSTHANLSELSKEELVNEISNSKKVLEQKLKKSISDFAYPRGKYNDSVLKQVKKAGFKAGWTMDDGFLGPQTNLLQIPRIGVDRTHSLEEFKTLFSPSAILMRKLIKQSPIGGLL